MRSIGHFIGGKEVKGTSGRTADVFEPMTGDVQAKVALASQGRSARGGRERQGRAAGMGGDQSAAPRARDDEIPRAGAARLRQARRAAGARARQDRSRRQGRHPARPRSGRVRDRHPASDEGRIHRRRRPRHRHLFAAPAARRRRRHHAVQFPGDDSDVEVRAGDRLRQRLHPEALGARSRRADEARGVDDRGGPAARHPQRRQRRQGSGRRHPRRSRHQGGRLRRLVADRAVHL